MWYYRYSGMSCLVLIALSVFMYLMPSVFGLHVVLHVVSMWSRRRNCTSSAPHAHLTFSFSLNLPSPAYQPAHHASQLPYHCSSFRKYTRITRIRIAIYLFSPCIALARYFMTPAILPSTPNSRIPSHAYIYVVHTVLRLRATTNHIAW